MLECIILIIVWMIGALFIEWIITKHKGFKTITVINGKYYSIIEK